MPKTFELEDGAYVIVKTVEEADEYVSDDMIESALEWFIDKRGVPSGDFLDRLATRPRTEIVDGELVRTPGIEFEDFTDPGTKRVLSRARKLKREMDDYNLS